MKEKMFDPIVLEKKPIILKVLPKQCPKLHQGCLGLFIPHYKGQRYCLKCKSKTTVKVKETILVKKCKKCGVLLTGRNLYTCNTCQKANAKRLSDLISAKNKRERRDKWVFKNCKKCGKPLDSIKKTICFSCK